MSVYGLFSGAEGYKQEFLLIPLRAGVGLNTECGDAVWIMNWGVSVLYSFKD